MAKFKVQHEGKEIEVEVDAVPLSEVTTAYVPRAHHDAEFGKLRKKLSGLVDPEEILKDDEFKTKALTAWSIDPSKPGKATAEEINRARDQVIKTEVEPLKKQVEALTAKVLGARKKDLTFQIVEAARKHGVDRQFLTTPENLPNAPPPFVNMVADYFGHDEERDMWFTRNGDTFAFALKPTNDNPYKGVDEFIGEFVKASPQLLGDQRQRGPGVRTPAGGGGGGEKGMVRVAIGDPKSFGNNLEAIADGRGVFE